MASYRYAAKNMEGNRVRGILQAPDREAAYQKIRSSGYYILWMREVKKRRRHRVLPAGQMAQFCENLSAMLGSGLSLTNSLAILIRREKQSGLQDIYRGVYNCLVRGSSFSEALTEQDGVFPPLFIGMFQAGEGNGGLEDSARRLAKLYRGEEQLRKKLNTSMLYPAFLLVMTFASLILIFTTILPEFFELFDSLERLPLTTRLLMRLSSFLVERPVFSVLALLLLLAAVLYLAGRPRIHNFLHFLRLKLPVAGRLMKVICTARFARTLGILYSSGLPLVQALEISSAVVGNQYIEAQFSKVIENVKDGNSLGQALSQVDGLEERVVTGIFIGEEAGKLEVMLERTAENLDFEANEAAARLVSLAEPVVIILLAVVIGTILLSVMLPLYQYYQMLGG